MLLHATWRGILTTSDKAEQNMMFSCYFSGERLKYNVFEKVLF
jgi:hypothetical protein